jgi:DNA polymerase-3 subunit gamma/tau
MTLLRMLAFRPDEGGGKGTAPASSGSRPASGPSRVTAAPSAASESPRAAAAEVAAVDPSQLPWAERIDTLGLDGSLRNFARQCAWVGQADGVIRLAVGPDAAFLLHESRRAAIEQALAKQCGTPVRVLIETAGGDTGAATPAALEKQRELARQRASESAVNEDPVVRAFKEQFGAAVRPGSLKPH